MTAAATQPTPAVPPRPSRSPDKDSSSGSIPTIPPRPSKKRPGRSLSPNADRFAPSPLNEGILAKGASKSALLSPNHGLHEPVEDPIDRAGSVPMPSVGEEGMEYSAVADEIEHENEQKDENRASPPEQTRTVAHDLQLHAPKPSLPADSAKQRVMAVTRTDSDKAAAFGIGRPSHVLERPASHDGTKKKPSTSFSGTSDHGLQTEDEHGIPEIGQRVPMNPHLGDVQAPSPGPSENSKNHHVRKHSARGLPPGSYGLHGHGLDPQDKFEKAYYQKHPDLLKREEHTPLHERQNDYAMSSTELNRLVRDTASRGAGYGTAPEFRGTPADEVGFQASEEYARMSSPRPDSTVSKEGHRRSSSLAKTFSNREPSPSIGKPGEGIIHVDDPKHAEYRSYGDDEAAVDEDEDDEYHAPILAPDEVQKDSNAYPQQPAIHPRRGSSYEAEESPSGLTSRPTSLHHNDSQPEIHHTPLEDVEEYEPLFPEETKKETQPVEAADENKHHNHFPSKDIWEDAPSSVHYTATVSTPDLPESEHHRTKSSGHHEDRPITPAHVFAQHQEKLAEREAKRRSGGNFPPLSEEKEPIWSSHQAHLKVERPASGPRFPSRDIWEDAPESQLHEATISSPEEEEKKQPEIPDRPVKKSAESSERPAIPTRPKPRQSSGDDAKPRPPVADKPKPQIPARPTKEKPPVPSRPVGNKIAALQAGFMSDLNKRLQLGPQANKKEEPPEQEAAQGKEKEKEKMPLSDARKGRARGPQRRAPAKSPAPVTQAAKPAAAAAPALSFSLAQVTWSIDPECGSVAVDGQEETAQSPVKEYPVKEAEEKPTEEEAKPKSEEEKGDELEQLDKAEEEQATVDDTGKEEGQEQPKEEKTLAANTGSESVLEATVEKTDNGNEVEPVDEEDEVKPGSKA